MSCYPRGKAEMSDVSVITPAPTPLGIVDYHYAYSVAKQRFTA